MEERRERGTKLVPPTKAEIEGYLRERSVIVEKLFAEEEIKPETEGVRIVDETGKFLGWGKVGEYDWFYVKKKPNGKSAGHFWLHHRGSSKKYNMTMVDQPINLSSNEMEKIINEITSQ